MNAADLPSSPPAPARGQGAAWRGIVVAAGLSAAGACVTHSPVEAVEGGNAPPAASAPELDARDAADCPACDATMVSASPDGAGPVAYGKAAASGAPVTDSTTLADAAIVEELIADEPEEAALGPQDGSSSGCAGLFCEDFEKGTIEPSIWNAQANGGQTVAVETSVVAHGKYAVQFHAAPNIESYDFIITKNAPVALLGHHFGRAYFNVTPKPPTEHAEFLFAGTAGFPNLKYLEVASIGTPWQLTYVDLIGTTGESYASGGVVPVARWSCLEWEFNDTPDQATVFVDGVQSYSRSTIAFQGQSSGLVGGFTDFGFGYYDWHPVSYPFDVYYDDIVLDTKRIGCLAGP